MMSDAGCRMSDKKIAPNIRNLTLRSKIPGPTPPLAADRGFANKKPCLWQGFSKKVLEKLSQRAYELGQSRFLVTRVVFVDHILLRQFVQHRNNLLVKLHRFHFVSCRFQSFDESPGGFGLISVSQTLRFVGTNSLKS